MGDHDDQSVTGQLLEHIQHLLAGDGVQGACWLIRQEDSRVVHQGTGNGHALHLAAGELVWFFVHLVRKPHAAQGVQGALPALLFADARQGKRQLHIGQHALVRNQVVGLEHKAHAVVAVGVHLPLRIFLGAAAVDAQIARVVAVQPANDVEQRGFAAAGRAQYGNKLPFFKREADILERFHLQGAALVNLLDVS